ncbi:conserved hypothetical protein [Histoplasma mississippiense (nom. inval.)]|uniref:conserved hypothetical protein n=1 Tax=Ajellomyces capsulatus (strain NAm1 / WU24) TaxID=2059318 RepID=UPI000157CA6E|nr:conserved hypothetical protein [Histoplasma mississippiense (nom. inval.)]EDN09091.1 conserved hypothetical protein [Histoplasma mississippiense (nom. inval.)]
MTTSIPLSNNLNKSNYRESIVSNFKKRSTLYALVALSLLNVFLLTNTLYRARSSGSKDSTRTAQINPFHLPGNVNASETEFIKPEDIIISGFVFYGRRDRVEAMRCYVERNLADNNGWLDEVLWVVNTENEDDLRYLDEILASSPRHRKLDLGRMVRGPEFRQIWKHLERGKIYVKIDDDVVWLADDTIPRIVDWKLKHPNDFAVSANIINNPPLGFIHYHVGALHPYFPELANGKPSTNVSDNKSWRPSDHPHWEGPDKFEWALDAAPPAKGHRWLRVKDDKAIVRTPATHLKYEVWGDTYTSWAIAAQQHYSFLENLENNQLGLYKFNLPWNMDNERIRINVLAIWADDILDNDINTWPKERSDEEMVVMELPKLYSRPVTIVGEALAVHFNFQHQPGVAETDLLDRYRILARERACPPASKPVS